MLNAGSALDMEILAVSALFLDDFPRLNFLNFFHLQNQSEKSRIYGQQSAH